MEIWKPIPGYSDTYEASSYGNVRRIKPSNSRRWKNCPLPFPIGQRKNKKGYFETHLHNEAGKAVTFRIHRLVALTFLPAPSIKNPEVNHIDLNKENNHADNLEYCTRKENWHHALGFNSIRQTIPRGEAHWAAKLKESDVAKIREMLVQKVFQKDIAAIFGVRQNTISKIKTGKLRAPFIPK